MIGHGHGEGRIFGSNSSATDRSSGGGERPHAHQDCAALPGPREHRQAIGIGDTSAGDLNVLLALLVALMLACGVAVAVTVNFAPAYADDSGDGY